MARTDILFDPDNINAVAATGSLNIATSPDIFTSSDTDKEPEIRLTPSESSLQLGSRQEEWSPSTVSLFNEGSPRIYLTSGTGRTSDPETNPEEQVFTVRTESDNEKAGLLEMGKVGEGLPTVELDAGRSLLSLGTYFEPGRIWLQGEDTNTISLEGEEATIEVGGVPRVDGEVSGTGVAGSIELRNSKGADTVIVEGSTETEGDALGGRIRLNDRAGFSNVKIDGGTGTLVLGQSSKPTDSDRIRGEIGYVPSVNGELWLDDGHGSKFGLKAESGTIGFGPSSESSGIGLVLESEKGVFSIVDANGNAVFEIDTQNETVRTAYSREDM